MHSRSPSIAAHPPVAAIEVIVIDDATPDGSTECLASVSGIRLMTNPNNLGYLRSCNAAARIAKGEFLLLLNNDTQVLPDWLDPLLLPFRCRSDVGAVGSKLLYPDGRLQEAGCIIWNDGSGWNYGRLDSPDRPAYNYLREVDYCSAASLLVPRVLFNTMGGSTNATRRPIARTAILPSGCANAASRYCTSRVRGSCITRE